MSDIDDLPFDAPDSQPNLGAPPPRKCRRHAWGPTRGPGRLMALGIAERWPEVTTVCVRCGKPHNPVASRRGRTSRRAGHDAERLVERETGLTKVGEFGSPVDVGDAASWAIGQVKAGHRYSLTDEADLDRMAAEAHGRPRLLFKVKRPGPGHARRITVTLRLSEFIAEHGDALVTLDLPDWKELHGGKP